MTMLSIASLNIHQFLHREETLRALKEADTDVFFLQEVPVSVIQELEQELEATAVFVPMGNFSEVGEDVGLGIFTRRGLLIRSDEYLYHEGDRSHELSFTDCDRILQHVVIEKDGVAYRLGHTHFVWTPKGESDLRQFAAMEQLLSFTDQFQDMILCGDFNAPRGKATWNMLTKKFTDNIPASETTTLDQVMHRATPIHYVVDGMFTKGKYTAHDVAVTPGASDHMLITARISA